MLNDDASKALVNFTLLLYSSFIYGLTKICYGNLRAVEVEQLTERAWFAITETCLAMTIFREEIGAWFLIMFTALVTGKVWGWIGDGRVEFLEQQPPANPRLFHLRLSASLAVSFMYDIWILNYTVNTVIQKARPNMMVMFLFEFAVLATCSWRTGVRYILSIVEQNIIKTQTRRRLFERRQEIREQRESMVRDRERAGAEDRETQSMESLPSEEDIDEIDVEVPGWAAKGEWVLWLDLVADMIKLGIYIVFFFMLLRFYGLPIHIMRDLFMTSRDFIKRLNALLRYRRAIKELNRYPDASVEELLQENTCIICREDMRPWDPVNQPGAVDRTRPKKLPCGHVLHLGCLKSWLERQQVCPTCRSPVSTSRGQRDQSRAENLRIQLDGLPRPAAGQRELDGNNGAGERRFPNIGQMPAGRRGGARVFNLGPIRLGFGANAHQARELAEQFGLPQGPINQPEVDRPTSTQNQPPPGDNMQRIGTLLHQTEQIVQVELQSLHAAQQELQVANLLMAEMQRLRQRRQQLQDSPIRGSSTASGPPPQTSGVQLAAHPQFHLSTPFTSIPPRTESPFVARHGIPVNGSALPAGSPDLPDGLVLPPGWSMIPLQRLDGTLQQPQPLFASTEQPLAGESARPTQSVMGTVIAAAHRNADRDAATATSHGQGQAASESYLRDGTGNRSSALRSMPVVSPSPVLPVWAGPSQLFNNQNPTDAVEDPSSCTGGNAEVGDGQSTESQGRESSGGASTNAAATSSLLAREAGSDQAEGPEGPEGTLGKGKAKAVTVEEANDDE
ncbi:hypothetical protein E4U42_003472 [Claviceps africana]|uniref:RING-type E3 ubiquitin transferase n=1 Tax=Claviceps africana TaxID=83212 RepID=A0A8K0J968_9HYPO|nr:hypothetical protein E4U42_003472 [Claviceps africana]